ncbi:hypothetical protein Tco_0333544 [Tanacetum coccineum]
MVYPTSATPFFTQRKESSSEYLRIKERELELEERKRQEQGELERPRIAQRDKELDLQQKMFEFQQQQKFEEDLKYYNEDHDHLTGRALSTTLAHDKEGTRAESANDWLAHKGIKILPADQSEADTSAHAIDAGEPQLTVTPHDKAYPLLVKEGMKVRTVTTKRAGRVAKVHIKKGMEVNNISLCMSWN